MTSVFQRLQDLHEQARLERSKSREPGGISAHRNIGAVFSVVEWKTPNEAATLRNLDTDEIIQYRFGRSVQMRATELTKARTPKPDELRIRVVKHHSGHGYAWEVERAK